MRDLFSSPQTQKKTKNEENIYYQIAACIGKMTKFTNHSLRFLVDAWWGDNSFIFGVQNKKTRTQYYS